jgi:hypothetical protein
MFGNFKTYAVRIQHLASCIQHPALNPHQIFESKNFHLKYIIMKKLIILTLVAMGFVGVASAQRPGDRFRRHTVRNGFENRQLTRPERFDIRKNEMRYKMAERKSRRDGIVSPMERRRLNGMKRHNKAKTFRYKHNIRRRVI